MRELLTMSAAARELGLSSDRLRQLARAGRLAVVLTPYGRVVPRAEVARLLAERRARALKAEENGGANE
jgi:predicted site-specific integrase-resolvase